MAGISSELFVITGGGTGMGRAIALALSQSGSTVVVVGRRTEPLHEVVSAARSGSLEAVTADVSTPDGVDAVVDAIAGRTVTGIVTAAGGQGAFKDGGSDPAAVRARWSDAMDKNFFSALLPVEALTPHLADHRGRVVLISSTAALDGQGGPYASAKAALTGYGMDLARRLGPRGITVNVVAPGFVADTGFFEAGGYGPADPMIDRAAGATLVGRVGTTRDVTHTVLGLLHHDAGWTTGQLLSPNGGSVLQHSHRTGRDPVSFTSSTIGRLSASDALTYPMHGRIVRPRHWRRRCPLPDPRSTPSSSAPASPAWSQRTS